MTAAFLTVAALLLLHGQQDVAVRGTVVDDVTRQPVAGAAVLLIRPESPADARLTTADIKGRFVFEGVAPGAYRLRAERDDYLRGDLTTVSVTPGSTVDAVALTLTPTAVISGRVTDEFGEPASRVFVRASTTRTVAEARTNDLGEYRLFGLPPGAYVVSAERYAGPSIQGDAVLTPTPPCPDCPGEGFGRAPLSRVLQSGGFIDPRALTRETYPTVFYPGTVERSEATPVKAAAGGRIDGIDLRLVAK